jgi:hypothetical protein
VHKVPFKDSSRGTGKDDGWDKVGLHRLWTFAYCSYHVKHLLLDAALAENI